MKLRKEGDYPLSPGPLGLYCRDHRLRKPTAPFRYSWPSRRLLGLSCRSMERKVLIEGLHGSSPCSEIRISLRLTRAHEMRKTGPDVPPRVRLYFRWPGDP